MKEAQQKLVEFMIAAKQECPTVPTMPNNKIKELRLNLILEEFEELCEAFGYSLMADAEGNFIHQERIKPNLVEAYDGMIDLLYVVLGTIVACGLDAEKGFNEIHESNMTKFIDGTFREDGKYLKGPSYRKPNLEQFIKE